MTTSTAASIAGQFAFSPRQQSACLGSLIHDGGICPLGNTAGSSGHRMVDAAGGGLMIV
jgi:hypothetical protein